jgi:hypothetical protein
MKFTGLKIVIEAFSIVKGAAPLAQDYSGYIKVCLIIRFFPILVFYNSIT